MLIQVHFACATILCWIFATVAAGASPPGGSVYSLRASNDSSADYPFLPEWEPNLIAGPTGCSTANTGHWTWRVSGLGCNMNLLLSAYLYWVYGWEWTNLAIIVGGNFDHIQCVARAPTMGVSGWDCIFRPMPHICTFRTLEEYSSFLLEQGATQQTVNDSLEITNDDTWRNPRGQPYPGFIRSPHPSEMESRNMVARHIWGHFQPWVRDDIRELNACLPLGVREGPYIGLHIRRGDKLAHEAHLTPAEDYLTVAVDTLLHRNEECTGARQLLVDECKLGMLLLPEHINGIFVASDDDVVVEEIRELVPLFLPNVKAENVVYMSDGKAECNIGPQQVTTRVWKQDYLAMIYLLHDIDVLVKSNIFVGTFSSNLGRFITTLRGETKGSFGAESSKKRWKPN